MPESRCRDCGAYCWKPDDARLKQWEFGHHNKSFKRFGPKSSFAKLGKGLHKCRTFVIYEDGEMGMGGYRIYNSGKLVEEEYLRPY